MTGSVKLKSTERFIIDGMNAMHEWSPELLGKNLYRETTMRMEDASFDCRCLITSYETFYHHERWRDFANSWEEFREKWFKCPQDWLEHLVKGFIILDGEGHTGPVPAGEAVEKSLSSVGAPKGNQNAKKAIADGNDKDLNKGSRPNLCLLGVDQPKKIKRGDNTEYLLARIERDRPEVLAQIGEGKTFQSPHAAALHCGFVKKRQHIYVSTPEKMAQKVREILTPEELHQLAALLYVSAPEKIAQKVREILTPEELDHLSVSIPGS